MNDLYSVTSIINILLVIAAMVGGYMALKSGKHRTSGEIQGQAIEALKAELDVMRSRLEALEKENTKLEQTMGLIRQALRRRGMTISIEGDLVTIDDGLGSSQTGRVHLEEDK